MMVLVQEQRIGATAICYLNDVAEGGETIFPKLDISVKPKMGSLSILPI